MPASGTSPAALQWWKLSLCVVAGVKTTCRVTFVAFSHLFFFSSDLTAPVLKGSWSESCDLTSKKKKLTSEAKTADVYVQGKSLDELTTAEVLKGHCQAT